MAGPQICPHTTIGLPFLIHILCGTSCPRCIVKAHIARIKDVQKQLQERGGIFESKVAGNTGPSSHQQLKTEWRKAKIALLNLIEQCEETLRQKMECENEGGKLPKAWKVLVEAVKDFEMEKIELGMVPGLEVLPDNIEVADWGKVKEMEIMQRERKVAEQKLEMRAGRREATKAKAIAHRMIRELSRILRAVIKEVDEEIAQEERLAVMRASTCDTFPSNTAAESHMNEDLSDAASRSSLTSGKPGAKADGETNELGFFEINDRTECLDPEGTLSLNPSTSTSKSSSGTPNAARNPSPTISGRNSLVIPRSAFRHKSNIDCSNLASRKRAKIANEVLISEAYSLSDTDNPSPATTAKPHSKHTTAENRRLRAHYKRTSPCYKPNSWASPDGCEKINTSYFRLDRPHVKRIWAGDEVKRDDTTGGSGEILEWNSLDAYEKLGEENVELNRVSKEVCKKEKVEGLVKTTKETEEKDAIHSAGKDEDDMGTACVQNDREVLTRAEEESNKEAKVTRKKHEPETLVKAIKDVQKEEALTLSDFKAYMKNRRGQTPLKRAEEEFKKRV